jgi:hypothetical protein
MVSTSALTPRPAPNKAQARPGRQPVAPKIPTMSPMSSMSAAG